MAETLQRSVRTAARFSPLTIDGTAKVLAAILVGGFPGLTPQPDYERAKLVVYLGVNPVVSHGHSAGMPSPTTTVRSLRSRAEVWVVDPRLSETACLASHHIAPRPGTDYAILAYLVRELLREGADPGVLADRAVGGDALRAAVEPDTRGHTPRLADVPAAQLTPLAAAIRRARHLAIATGTGITMSAGAHAVQGLARALPIPTRSV